MGSNYVGSYLEGGAADAINVEGTFGLLPGGTVGHDTTGIGDGRQTVTSAGTDVALAGSTTAKWVIVTAETNNTDIVCVGATGVDAALATRTGTPLFPGDSVSLLCDNLADIFIDALVSSEGVSFTYGT